MSRSRKKNMVSLPLLTGLLSCSAYSIYAQSASENYGLITGYGGTWLGQGNALVNGSQAVQNNSCVPTSVANGLSYMQAYGYSTDSNPFSTNPNTYDTVNALQTAMGTTATGTQPANSVTGLQTWLSANPTTPPISTYLTINPSPQALANVLNANDGVQLGILWGSVTDGTFTAAGGGHYVSLDAIDLTGGSGTIGILDPWGNSKPNAASTASQDTLDVSTVTIGTTAYLEVQYQNANLGDYPTPAPGTAYAGAGGIGVIALDQVETLSAVPEPSSLVISGLASAGIGGFVFLRRRKV